MYSCTYVHMYSQGIGVDMAEFRRISSWVSQKELSDHVAKVLYVLLDEDGDGRSVENILEHSGTFLNILERIQLHLSSYFECYNLKAISHFICNKLH